MTRTHQKNGIAKCLQEIICCVLKEVISYSLVRESISTSNLSRRSHPNRKSNPSLLDNGPLNPRGPAIAIASEFIGKQLEFKNVCLFGCTVAVCVCEREMELMWVDACVCVIFLWALLSDFPARVRFTAGFLQDESDFLIEQPHGSLSVPSLMRITSNRWSLRARRKEELAGNACLLCVCRDGYLYSSSKTFFLHPVRKWNHQYDISWTVCLSKFYTINAQTAQENLKGVLSVLADAIDHCVSRAVKTLLFFPASNLDALQTANFIQAQLKVLLEMWYKC